MRHLLDDEDTASVAHDPVEFLESFPRGRDVMQHEHGQRDVDCRLRNRQLREIALVQLDIIQGVSAYSPLRHLQHRVDRIHTDNSLEVTGKNRK